MQLAQQHCLYHGSREAVARCPECKYFYCRECITEHDDRVVCAKCLKQLTRGEFKTKRAYAIVGRLFLCSAGFLTAFLFFYWLGQALLSIPADFHEGTVWKTGFWEE